jgi:prophage regulatory protein
MERQTSSTGRFSRVATGGSGFGWVSAARFGGVAAWFGGRRNLHRRGIGASTAWLGIYDHRAMSTATSNRPSAPGRFLREAEVLALTGLRPSTLDMLEVRGEFPRRIPIGERSVAWSEAEVRQWQLDRLSLRDDPAADERARLQRTPAWHRVRAPA